MSAEPMLVGFQGEPGAYSEATALEVFSAAGMAITPVGYSSFDDVFAALARGETEYAAIPFENTLGGSVHVNYDLLLRYHGQVHIMGEHSLRVRHALLALPGVKMEELKQAMSHPQVGLASPRFGSKSGALSTFCLKTWRTLHVLAQNVAHSPRFGSKSGALSTFWLKHLSPLSLSPCLAPLPCSQKRCDCGAFWLAPGELARHRYEQTRFCS